MKKLTILLGCFYLSVAMYSCKKDDPTPATNNNNNNNNNTATCKDGDICFKLDGADISKAAGGYAFADTFLFVKYEEGVKQLSIDIFGSNTGNYTISDVRKVSNARIYYFPDGNKMYMASKGALNVSVYSATDKKLTGTFSGTLYLYDNSKGFTYTDSVVITDGYFTKVALQ